MAAMTSVANQEYGEYVMRACYEYCLKKTNSDLVGFFYSEKNVHYILVFALYLGN